MSIWMGSPGAGGAQDNVQAILTSDLTSISGVVTLGQKVWPDEGFSRRGMVRRGLTTSTGSLCS